MFLFSKSSISFNTYATLYRSSWNLLTGTFGENIIADDGRGMAGREGGREREAMSRDNWNAIRVLQTAQLV